ncbi:tetratricopeptide repeat protein [Shewanella atlantica]|uniref:tetratricopeptide repeat protein n=1 Tax=Shewanella atlantica TaxID=271099 RepID=UPI0037353625
MTILLISIVIICILLLMTLFGHHTLYGIKHTSFFSNDNEFDSNRIKCKGSCFVFVVLLNITVVVSILITYSYLGRYKDIDFARADTNVDYLLAAEINRARKQADEYPNDKSMLMSLARVSMDGGLYLEAVEALDELLEYMGDDAEVFGLKATALYYKNNRSMTGEVKLLTESALALYQHEFNARVLLANDAYINHDYQAAINHWQNLLNNTKQSFNRSAIEFAINNAQNNISR